MSRAIRVMCVDDSASVADALRVRLAVESGIEWAGHLTSADGLERAADRADADVVLLDLEMPGRDPFEAMIALGGRERPRIVVLSGDLNPERVGRARAAGAAGMVDKREHPSAIVEAIRRAAAGRDAASPAAHGYV